MPEEVMAKIENLKNAKSVNAIAVTVGQEIETKKHGYVIVREIKKGKYSRVYEVRRNRDQKILAMKAQFQSDNTVNHGKGAMLQHEAHIYHELSQLSRKVPRDEIRFLNIYDHGECGEGLFIFITLQSETLANVLSDEKIPSHQTALDLSYQMFNTVEQSSRDAGKKVVSEKGKESSSATSESGVSSSTDGKAKNESIICSMSDAVKTSAASGTDTKASTPPSSKPRRIIAAVNSGSPNPSSASPKQNSIPSSNC